MIRLTDVAKWLNVIQIFFFYSIWEGGNQQTRRVSTIPEQFAWLVFENECIRVVVSYQTCVRPISHSEPPTWENIVFALLLHTDLSNGSYFVHDK